MLRFYGLVCFYQTNSSRCRTVFFTGRRRLGFWVIAIRKSAFQCLKVFLSEILQEKATGISVQAHSAKVRMRIAVLVCCLGFALANHEHHGRRRNMLDRNQTPRRQIEVTDDTGERSENGDGCDLKGAWYNQHGSELILNQTEGGKLIGEFRTGVRLNSGGQTQDYTEGRTFSPVHGHVHGRLFTFHVYWPEKQSVTSWSGQCQRNCDFGWFQNRDILHASWLITILTSQCEDYWSATRVGEDIFTRLPMKSGPRRSDEINRVLATA